MCIAAVALMIGGCTRSGNFQAYSMWNESRLKPLESDPQVESESSSRVVPPGTIARGEVPEGDRSQAGRESGKLITKPPIAITTAVLERGQQRFNIYCAPCHGKLGDGEGMIVKRGFPHPPDYAIPRLRNAPIGHYFDVMTNGYGVMYSYASRVTPNDRWAIAAYIRVLQKARPVVPIDKWEQQRIKARHTGLGTQPLRPTQ